MTMNVKVARYVFERTIYLFLRTLLLAVLVVQPAHSQERLAIPPGTILPVQLNSSVSSTKSRPGQVITGRITQDVPLTAGVRIREGGKVIGHIVEVTRATGGTGGRISLQFDT
jgi:hypothetical protein